MENRNQFGTLLKAARCTFSCRQPGVSRIGPRQKALCLAFLAAALAFADPRLPPQLEGVGVTEHLGGAVDPRLTFIAENGYPVALGQFLNQGRPVILNLVYYSCPMLCNLVLNGQTAALRDLAGTPGKEFEVVTISIDPSETFDMAQRKRGTYLASYARPTTGWHFLTDHDGNAKKLAAQVGFRYSYDDATKQFAHPAVIMVLTPEGKLSRYLYGIRFKVRDLRLSLAEASGSKLAFVTDRVLLFCFHYDPQARGYVLFAANFMRAAGALMTLVMGAVLFRLWRHEAR